MSPTDDNNGVESKTVVDVVGIAVFLTGLFWSLATYSESHGHPQLRDFWYYLNFVTFWILATFSARRYVGHRGIIISIAVLGALIIAHLMFPQIDRPVPKLDPYKWRFALPALMAAFTAYLLYVAIIMKNPNAPAGEETTRPVAVPASAPVVPPESRPASAPAQSQPAPANPSTHRAPPATQAAANQMGWSISPQEQGARSTQEFAHQVAELLAYPHNYTSAQRQRISTDAIGKWLRVSGAVREVWNDVSGILVEIGGPGRPSCLLSFNPTRSDRPAALSKGDQITADGIITRIDGNGLSLRDCELVT
jgi:hypothetical protein